MYENALVNERVGAVDVGGVGVDGYCGMGGGGVFGIQLFELLYDILFDGRVPLFGHCGSDGGISCRPFRHLEI